MVLDRRHFVATASIGGLAAMLAPRLAGGQLRMAMALSELITTKYPKDTLDIVVFGNDAWPVEIKDLPYLQVGPYHTNTVAGLELAMVGPRVGVGT